MRRRYGWRAGVLPECWITEARTFHDIYEQAKAEAERYLQNVLPEGLPITIHHPSMVIGDAGSGRIIHFQIFYALTLLQVVNGGK